MGVKILGLETSCDETSCAIVEDGRNVLANTIYSQISEHAKYGGVVPEIASRRHIEKISYVVDETFKKAGLKLYDIDAVAVTYGPGLVGALLCGVSYAKALAYTLSKPLIKVHHIKGHIAAAYICFPDLTPPFLSLVVSGGHSHIIRVTDYNKFKIIAKTRDDAAGEAFDKVGRVMGFPYPGGAKVDGAAHHGDKGAILFPRVTFVDSLDFSFSGLKTAVINFIHRIEQRGISMEDSDTGDVILSEALSGGGVRQIKNIITKGDIAASFTEAVTGVLAENTIKAAKCEGMDKIIIAGGVACNSHLRAKFNEMSAKENIHMLIPKPEFCTDNAAMIGAMGYYHYLEGEFADLSLNAVPYADIEEAGN